MANRKTLFVSSVQNELSAERRAIKSFLQNDPLLRRFFDVFLFEDLPASDRRTDDVYLGEVENCDLYVGIFGSEYQWQARGEPVMNPPNAPRIARTGSRREPAKPATVFRVGNAKWLQRGHKGAKGLMESTAE